MKTADDSTLLNFKNDIIASIEEIYFENKKWNIDSLAILFFDIENCKNIKEVQELFEDYRSNGLKPASESEAIMRFNSLEGKKQEIYGEKIFHCNLREDEEIALEKAKEEEIALDEEEDEEIALEKAKKTEIDYLIEMFKMYHEYPSNLLTFLLIIENSQEINEITNVAENYLEFGLVGKTAENEVVKLTEATRNKYYEYKKFFKKKEAKEKKAEERDAKAQEKDAKAQERAQEKAQKKAIRDLKKAEEVAKKKAEETLKKVAEEIAKKEVEETLKKEAEEIAKKEAERKALNEQRATERKKRYEDGLKIKSKVIKKGQENFEKFQPFFDFLRSKEYFEIGEIGFFGSRVYKEFLSESFSTRKIAENPNADFDFYCLPKSTDSLGVFRIYQDEIGSKINFLSLLTEFNERNPNIQIQLIEDVDIKKSVNYGGGVEKSLNFKLVATFFDDKIEGEKSEKIIKEHIEFDLNFYTKQSALQKLQWQINLERLILVQGLDGATDLKLNQSNCDSSQNITTEKFIFEVLGEGGKNFLIQINPNANKFLDRIVNKKGVYKYLEDQELDEIKTTLLKDHRSVLDREFEEYKKFLRKAVGKNPFIDAKIAEYGKIIEAVKKDPILREIAEEITLVPASTVTKASAQSSGRGAR